MPNIYTLKRYSHAPHATHSLAYALHLCIVNANTEKIMKTYIVKKYYDPCYGYKPMPVGTRVKIKSHKGDIRVVWSETEGNFPGFGMRISEFALNNFFI